MITSTCFGPQWLVSACFSEGRSRFGWFLVGRVGFGWFWVVSGGFGWFWVIPFFSNNVQEGREIPLGPHWGVDQRVHRADSRIRLQWCQEITFHKCVKMAQY